MFPKKRQESPDTARINLRASAEAKAMLERAAAYMGTIVSAFMLQTTMRRPSGWWPSTR